MICPYSIIPPYIPYIISKEGVCALYGVFGGYTRWAVVFLIIFVLFFLLVPGAYGAYGMDGAAAAPGAMY